MYEDGGQVEAVAVDDRVSLMQQIVDMEQVRDGLQRNSDDLAKKAAKLSQEIQAARRELAGRMGWDDGNKPRAMSAEEAKRLALDRLAEYEGAR